MKNKQYTHLDVTYLYTLLNVSHRKYSVHKDFIEIIDLGIRIPYVQLYSKCPINTEFTTLKEYNPPELRTTLRYPQQFSIYQVSVEDYIKLFNLLEENYPDSVTLSVVPPALQLEYTPLPE